MYREATVTKHALRRMKERCGLPKKACGRLATTALNLGIPHGSLRGRLRKHVDYLVLSHAGRTSEIRVYGEFVYLFAGTTLITVLPLPNAHKKAVR